MTSQSIRDYLGPVSWVPLAPAYCVLTLADLLGAAFTDMRAEDWRFNVDQPVTGNVCRNFSRRVCVYLQDDWHESPKFDATIPDVAAFEFCFRPNPSRNMLPDPVTGLQDGHSVVLCFTEQGPKFIDYMNLTSELPTIWDLSSNEWASRYLVR